jgi:hypothetical protein
MKKRSRKVPYPSDARKPGRAAERGETGDLTSGPRRHNLSLMSFAEEKPMTYFSRNRLILSALVVLARSAR